MKLHVRSRCFEPGLCMSDISHRNEVPARKTLARTPQFCQVSQEHPSLTPVVSLWLSKKLGWRGLRLLLSLPTSPLFSPSVQISCQHFSAHPPMFSVSQSEVFCSAGLFSAAFCFILPVSNDTGWRDAPLHEVQCIVL